MPPSSMEPGAAVERDVHVDGLRLRYRETGDPAAMPVLLLHGLMGHPREWDTLTAALTPRFRVIGLHQRGHGESDRAAEYAAAAMAGDVLGLADLLGLRRFHLVGHSMGGMVASLCAARRPDLVDRLVMIDIGPDSLSAGFAEELPTVLGAFAEASYTRPDEAVDEWLAGNPLAREPLVRHYVEQSLVAGDDGLLRWRFDAAGLVGFATGGVTEGELWRAIDAITAPTLLVRGEHSPLLSRATAERVVSRLARGRLVEIPGGGHDLGVERPEAVATAVLDHLSE
ncbi:MAG: alpha/beta hydrolase [Acidimicrobiia bacterium]|nr:alpha/beta hydrolase [Acidimicrobiia bacterium]